MRKLKEIKYLIPAIEIFVQNLKWKTHLSLWKDCIVALLYFFYSIYLGRIESLPLYFNLNFFTFFSILPKICIIEVYLLKYYFEATPYINDAIDKQSSINALVPYVAIIGLR